MPLSERRFSTRPAISRLEVVTVLFLVFVGAGLVIAFLGRLRETANQKECADNLRRMGAAILAYHEQKQFLPPARIAPAFATWAVVVAPFVQKESGLDAWDFTKPFSAQPDKARLAILAPYYCPSRTRETLINAFGLGQEAVAGALGDYACASGDGDSAHPWTGPTANGAIILGEVLEEKDGRILKWQGRTTLASLTRGQSYTLLVGEKHVPLEKLGQTDAGDGALYDGGLPASSARIGGPGHGLAESPLAPFNTIFGSAHPGICQFLRADGSVQAFTVELSEEVLGRMVRRE